MDMYLFYFTHFTVLTIKILVESSTILKIYYNNFLIITNNIKYNNLPNPEIGVNFYGFSFCFCKKVFSFISFSLRS